MVLAKGGGSLRKCHIISLNQIPLVLVGSWIEGRQSEAGMPRLEVARSERHGKFVSKVGLIGEELSQYIADILS